MKIRFSSPLMKHIALFAVILMFGLASNGHAGGPQPAPANFILDKSQGVDGLLTAVVVNPNSDLAAELMVAVGQGPFVVQTILLTCKKAQILLGPSVDYPSPGPFELSVTKAECTGEVDPMLGIELCLEGWILPGEAADLLGTECFPDLEDDGFTPVDLAITRVKNFIKTDSSISAEVTLRLGTYTAP